MTVSAGESASEFASEFANEFARQIRGGDARFLARLISLVENGSPDCEGVLRLLHTGGGDMARAAAHVAAHVVGITGPPGSGKSTLTDKLVGEYRRLGKKVAVLAVDPTSPFSGGAILGDRIRMQRHATDDGVFIRSLATRGRLGGLSEAVCEAARVLESARFDIIIIETVGVGQSEVDIVRCADTVILVSVPGLGDDIQIIKAGIMEIGDIFVVNKSDKDGAVRVQREIKSMLEAAATGGAVTRFSKMYEARSKLQGRARAQENPHTGIPIDTGAFHHIASQARGRANLEIPPVLLTAGETGQGIAELAFELESHWRDLLETGFAGKRREENMAWELTQGLSRLVQKKLQRNDLSALLTELAHAVIQKNECYTDALLRLSKAANAF